jgi:RNA polymerase sigma factor (sigma-70 family)
VVGDGSDATFDAFCVAAYPRLVAALGHVVGDRAVAEELAQESLVCAHQRWRRVSQLDSPLGWAVHVGTNLARSHLRRRVLARRVDRQLAVDVSIGHIDPDAADAVAVREAMAALSSPQREAVVLRFVIGLTAVEAGRVLGIEPAAVRARTHRALGVMRGRLAIDEPDETESTGRPSHCEDEEVRRVR